MGFLSYFFYPWSLVLQVVAIIHFIRRRPEMYWLFIIIFLGPLGALIYLIVVALPDFRSLLRHSEAFRAASASASLRLRFSTIHPRRITRNSATFIWSRAAWSWLVPRSTRRSPRPSALSMPFTGALSAPSAWETFQPRWPIWSEW